MVGLQRTQLSSSCGATESETDVNPNASTHDRFLGLENIRDSAAEEVATYQNQAGGDLQAEMENPNFNGGNSAIMVLKQYAFYSLVKNVTGVELLTAMFAVRR